VGSRNPDGVAAHGRAFLVEHLLPHVPYEEAPHA